MSPKLHRRTPPSAHTYRLLIFKELQNSLSFRSAFRRLQIVLFAAAKKRNYVSFCDFRQAFRFNFFSFALLSNRFVRQQQRSEIMNCLSNFVNCYFVLSFAVRRTCLEMARDQQRSGIMNESWICVNHPLNASTNSM